MTHTVFWASCCCCLASCCAEVEWRFRSYNMLTSVSQKNCGTRPIFVFSNCSCSCNHGTQGQENLSEGGLSMDADFHQIFIHGPPPAWRQGLRQHRSCEDHDRKCLAHPGEWSGHQVWRPWIERWQNSFGFEHSEPAYLDHGCTPIDLSMANFCLA